jgi:hypothetical protein
VREVDDLCLRRRWWSGTWVGAWVVEGRERECRRVLVGAEKTFVVGEEGRWFLGMPDPDLGYVVGRLDGTAVGRRTVVASGGSHIDPVGQVNTRN